MFLGISRRHIDPELGTNRRTRGVVALAEDIVATTTRNVVRAISIVPGDNKAAIGRKLGYRRAVLVAAGRSAVDQELIDTGNRRFYIFGRKGLGEDINVLTTA